MSQVEAEMEEDKEVDEDEKVLDQTAQQLLLDEAMTLLSEEDEDVVNAHNLVDEQARKDEVEEEYPRVEQEPHQARPME